jgi:hypothetical protein
MSCNAQSTSGNQSHQNPAAQPSQKTFRKKLNRTITKKYPGAKAGVSEAKST